MNEILRFLPKYIRGLVFGAHLFTLGILDSKKRAFIYELCRFYNWRQNGVNPLLPEQHLADLGRIQPGVKIYEPAFEPGNVTLMELFTLICLASFIDPRRIFEIGTFDGRTSLNLAANFADVDLWTLDLPAAGLSSTKYSVEKDEQGFIEKPKSGLRFIGKEASKRITQLYGDSASFDYEPYAGTMDFVFVDGSHAYPYVLSDTNAALRLVRPGGMVVWHDYDNESWPGVTLALNELFKRDSRFSSMRKISGTTLVYSRF